MIYDGFLFWKEFDILEIRLHELSAVVDKFVLVEATHTFSGQPKPLYYAENRDRFKAFHDRIIHVVIDDLPTQPGPWEREYYSRNAILRGFSDCRPQDTVLISDVDEIPHPEAVAQHASFAGITVFFPRMYYYFLNCQANVSYIGTTMLPYGLLRQHSLLPQAIRLGHVGQLPYQVIKESGWHFSYIGSAREIREKIAAYAHQELNLPQYTDVRHILACMAKGQDLFCRAEIGFQFVAVDDSYPLWVRNNLPLYQQFISGDTIVSEDKNGDPCGR